MSEMDLKQKGILAYMCEEYLRALAAHGQFTPYQSGQILIQQGSIQGSLHVVCEGILEVIYEEQGQRICIGQVEPGDCVGEMGLFEDCPASASVRVSENTLVWSLSREGLQSFIQNTPLASAQLMLGITQLLARRLRYAGQTLIRSKALPTHLAVRCQEISDVSTLREKDHDIKKKPGYQLPTDIKL